MKLSKLFLIRTGFILSLVLALVFLAFNLSGVALGIAGFAAIALFFMVQWHARNSSYVCSECNHEFRVTPWVDFVSPHTFEKKWLTCPSCHNECWCRIH